MQRIERRTRANFERLFGKYPFGCGDKGSHSIDFEKAGSYELYAYYVNLDGLATGDPSEFTLTVATLKEMFARMPEGDLRSLAFECRYNFPQVAEFIEQEEARRHISKKDKTPASAKKNLKSAVKAKALSRGSSVR
jgi:hypothetical protein